MDLLNFGKQVKKYRESLHLSSEYVASYLELPLKQYKALEKKQIQDFADVSIDINHLMEKCTRLFGVSAEDMMQTHCEDKDDLHDNILFEQLAGMRKQCLC